MIAGDRDCDDLIELIDYAVLEFAMILALPRDLRAPARPPGEQRQRFAILHCIGVNQRSKFHFRIVL